MENPEVMEAIERIKGMTRFRTLVGFGLTTIGCLIYLVHTYPNSASVLKTENYGENL